MYGCCVGLPHCEYPPLQPKLAPKKINLHSPAVVSGPNFDTPLQARWTHPPARITRPMASDSRYSKHSEEQLRSGPQPTILTSCMPLWNTCYMPENDVADYFDPEISGFKLRQYSAACLDSFARSSLLTAVHSVLAEANTTVQSHLPQNAEPHPQGREVTPRFGGCDEDENGSALGQTDEDENGFEKHAADEKLCDIEDDRFYGDSAVPARSPVPEACVLGLQVLYPSLETLDVTVEVSGNGELHPKAAEVCLLGCQTVGELLDWAAGSLGLMLLHFESGSVRVEG
ncbi:hypothetical protein FN846DRAFT_993413 [Sphaerosporella brunnea]|uniref:Uncharacterized protein n=1 Tax=Sphaerosporella brunnea TaxID=1250544 RepID=A0A5J5EM56_9PEZI|nr:hypothetical protein FN846DRAFT_993413 [Sphaerosporella brunnea]